MAFSLFMQTCRPIGIFEQMGAHNKRTRILFGTQRVITSQKRNFARLNGAFDSNHKPVPD